MSVSLTEINQALLAITDAHASGELDRMEFRRQRRALICQVTGEAPPALSDEEAAAQVSEDDTHPKMAAVEVPSAATGTPSGTAPEGDDAKQENASRLSSWKLTILLLLVALAGLAGLLWFVLR